MVAAFFSLPCTLIESSFIFTRFWIKSMNQWYRRWCWLNPMESHGILWNHHFSRLKSSSWLVQLALFSRSFDLRKRRRWGWMGTRPEFSWENWWENWWKNHGEMVQGVFLFFPIPIGAFDIEVDGSYVYIIFKMIRLWLVSAKRTYRVVYLKMIISQGEWDTRDWWHADMNGILITHVTWGCVNMGECSYTNWSLYMYNEKLWWTVDEVGKPILGQDLSSHSSG